MKGKFVRDAEIWLIYLKVRFWIALAPLLLALRHNAVPVLMAVQVAREKVMALARPLATYSPNSANMLG